MSISRFKYEERRPNLTAQKNVSIKINVIVPRSVIGAGPKRREISPGAAA